jgi:hypothetical protein
MRMMMRLQPKQVAKTWVLTTPGSGTIDVRLQKLGAPGGYMSYHAFCVGGAGGRSAQALGYAGTSGPYAGRAGGGGGGSILLAGVTSDLPDDVPYQVGAAGTQPANGANNADAPNGSAGGDSWFYDSAYSGFGGKGGIGGDYDGNSTSGNGTGSVGGAGGSNSGALGTGGVGGDGGTVSWSSSGTPDGSGFTSPTAGTYDGVGGPIGHPAPTIIGGGRGGGGGRPKHANISYPTTATAGAAGNNGGFSVPGSSASGNDGGYGGGGARAQADDYLNTEVYGSGGGGTNRFAQGCVIVQAYA